MEILIGVLGVKDNIIVKELIGINMAKEKGSMEIKISMDRFPYEKHLKKMNVKTKKQLEKALFEFFELDKSKGDSLKIKVLKRK